MIGAKFVVLMRMLPLAMMMIIGLVPMVDGFAWQHKLDKALLNVDGGSVQDRLELLRQVVQDSNFSKDVSKAFSILREEGLKDGHPEFIHILWPKGTIIRSDIEGLQALTKQLPERFEEIQNSPSDLADATLAAFDGDGTAVTSAVLELAQDSESIGNKIKNLFRSTPIGLDTPPYESIRNFTSNGTAVELRRYLPYRYAQCELASNRFTLANIGTGLGKLSSYLALGYNWDNAVMGMTTPFEIKRGGAGATTTMSFMLPAAFAEEPPQPMGGSGVDIGMMPERLVAVKSFSGICTDQEIGRQRALLFNALRDDSQLLYPDKTECSALQYNAPGALPWRRRNEIFVVVSEASNGDGEEDGPIAEIEVITTESDT